jgi:hypothetical protein
MKCKEFLGQLDEFISSIREGDDAFERNMEKLKIIDDTFCEWFATWLAWHELLTTEDCKRQYWQDGYD